MRGLVDASLGADGIYRLSLCHRFVPCPDTRARMAAVLGHAQEITNV
ncbi:hypothetical protein [Thalassorhabdomicrobium marinisediminis]|nr:hypothetical protein [Thalassorhabdomicrobium marinisediminis]